MAEINSEFTIPKEQQIGVVNSPPIFSQYIHKYGKHTDVMSTSIVNPIDYLIHGTVEQ